MTTTQQKQEQQQPVMILLDDIGVVNVIDDDFEKGNRVVNEGDSIQSNYCINKTRKSNYQIMMIKVVL